MTQRIFAVALLSLFLFGCSKDGLGAHVDRETAIAVARRDTPMTEIDKVDGSADLPFRHVILGSDGSGRAMVVWVNTGVTKYVYLDEIITKEQAISLAESEGLETGEGLLAVLGHLVGQDNRVYWHISNGSHYVRVDASSGQVMQAKVIED